MCLGGGSAAVGSVILEEDPYLTNNCIDSPSENDELQYKPCQVVSRSEDDCLVTKI